ncbi:hypothetical protein DCS_03321 [Drechmeria coniospora]|uniref:Uncharacterized protein n=1 Tax=Drechmeria coniospora TaxID=98403 RepID=A0A151GGU2_DRECN|nr:hypothetical protein DCS_03321 [Drechmeria coniospora]KYK56323.1 hypothetical protein DCS_03321 [Drechmeria coniospora]
MDEKYMQAHVHRTATVLIVASTVLKYQRLLPQVQATYRPMACLPGSLGRRSPLAQVAGMERRVCVVLMRRFAPSEKKHPMRQKHLIIGDAVVHCYPLSSWALLLVDAGTSVGPGRENQSPPDNHVRARYLEAIAVDTFDLRAPRLRPYRPLAAMYTFSTTSDRACLHNLSSSPPRWQRSQTTSSNNSSIIIIIISIIISSISRTSGDRRHASRCPPPPPPHCRLPSARDRKWSTTTPPPSSSPRPSSTSARTSLRMRT